MTHPELSTPHHGHGPKHQRAASQMHETTDLLFNLNGTMTSEFHEMSITGVAGANDTFGNQPPKNDSIMMNSIQTS